MADALASRWHLPRWKREGRSRATGGEAPFGPVHLLKPQTFMNHSGQELGSLRVHEPNQDVPGLLVLVDDFAIPAGTFRLRSHGSSGGHNGLKSVQSSLGTTFYNRLRVGVGPKPEGVDQADFVLDNLPRDDRRLVDDLMDRMCEAVECWGAFGIERAMSEFNRKTSQDTGTES